MCQVITISVHASLFFVWRSFLDLPSVSKWLKGFEVLKRILLKLLQRLQLWLPTNVKTCLLAFPFVRNSLHHITKKLYSDPSLYHRYALRQDGQLGHGLGSPVPDSKPTFHLVLCFENQDPKLLEQCIASVFDQQYDQWRLHVFRCSPNGFGPFVDNKWTDDVRFSLEVASKPFSLAEAGNYVLEQHPADYVAFIEPEGRLCVHSLAIIASTLTEHPNAKVVYADEDRVNKKGLRHSARFKPDWNPDLLNSYNYLGKPVVYRCSEVKRVGGFKGKFGEWAEYDLLLRLGQAKRAQIHHVDRVLYTTHSNEIVHVDEEMPLPALPPAEMNPLVGNLKGLPGVVISDGLVEGTSKISWPIPKQPPLVSLIMPTRNRKELVQQCIDSIVEKTSYLNYEILLIDNQSDEPDALKYFEELNGQANIRVLRYNHPFNYSAINNFAAANAKGSVLGFINNDIEVITPDWLREMVSHALREEIGCVGAKLYYLDGRIQHGGVIIGYGGGADHAYKYLHGDSPGYMNRLKVVQNYSAVTAACLVMRKSLFVEVGGFNERDLPVNFNDTDLCLRVREKGYRNLWTPYAELFHHESVSRGEDLTPQKRARYESEVAYLKRVWKTDNWKDPSYNSNLSLFRHDFALREF